MLKHTRVVLLWIVGLYPAFGYTPPMENQGRKPDAAEAARSSSLSAARPRRCKEGQMSCTPCPDFTSLHGLTTEQFQLRLVLGGNFTAPDSQDLAVFFEGCELLADNFGGAVLLNKTGDGWKMARYASSMRPFAVRTVRQSTGRDLLFTAPILSAWDWTVTRS